VTARTSDEARAREIVAKMCWIGRATVGIDPPGEDYIRRKEVEVHVAAALAAARAEERERCAGIATDFTINCNCVIWNECEECAGHGIGSRIAAAIRKET
jgi:hypothetical protein